MALNTPFFPMEDLYVTGFVAQKCKIKRLDNTGFRWGDYNYDSSIVSHQNCGGKGVNKKWCLKLVMKLAYKYAHRLKMELKKP